MWMLRQSHQVNYKRKYMPNNVNIDVLWHWIQHAYTTAELAKKIHNTCGSGPTELGNHSRHTASKLWPAEHWAIPAWQTALIHHNGNGFCCWFVFYVFFLWFQKSTVIMITIILCITAIIVDARGKLNDCRFHCLFHCLWNMKNQSRFLQLTKFQRKGLFDLGMSKLFLGIFCLQLWMTSQLVANLLLQRYRIVVEKITSTLYQMGQAQSQLSHSTSRKRRLQLIQERWDTFYLIICDYRLIDSNWICRSFS